MKLHRLTPTLLLLLSGCGALQPVKDLSVRHLLEPLVADRNLTASTPAIALKRPSLPTYLNRQQLVTRAAGQLVLSDLDLWGEPLDAAVSRVTAGNLSRLTGSMNIQPVENFTSLDYTALLELNIARFEPDEANNLLLQGTWKLQPVSGKDARPHFFRIAVPIPAAPDAMSGRVTAMNQALARLARQIVTQARR
jgi:uncharacterized lipoprotein YmbA